MSEAPLQLSNRTLFPCYIAPSKHSRSWENSRKLCKSSTTSLICITVSNSPNPPRVYLRPVCKHGKVLYFVISIVSLAIFYPHFSIRILSSAFFYPPSAIRSALYRDAIKSSMHQRGFLITTFGNRP